MNKSNKEKIVALILCIFLGTLGVHRFYVGKTKSGILYLCTLGLFGIGWIYDIFNIANNLFTDSYGAVLTSENANQNILNESKKKPAHMMWQFWVAVVVLYVFVFAMPSNSNTEPTQQTSTPVSDTDISLVSVSEIDTDTLLPVKTDSTDISITDDNNKYLFILDTNRKEYHLDEKCDSVFFPDDEDRINLTVTADDKKEAILYVESLGYSNCYKCVDKKAIDKYEEYIKTLNSDTEDDTDTDSSITIDTSTDTNIDSDTETNASTNSKIESKTESISDVVSVVPKKQYFTFTINNETGVFHSKNCGPSKQIADENKELRTIEAYTKQDAINEMINQGYTYCGQCAR